MQNALIQQSQMAAEFMLRAWRDCLKSAEAALKLKPFHIQRVFLTGCGDSHHAAVGLEMAFRLWSGRWGESGPAMRVGRYGIPNLAVMAKTTLVVGLSNSGEVARTVEALELAKESGAHTLALTLSPDSALAKVADASISLPFEAPPGPGLLSYLALLLLGFALCASLADEGERAQIIEGVEALARDLGPWLQQEQFEGLRLAEEAHDRQACVFAGAGPAYGSALFSAAKVIEAAGMPAWGQDLEEWAHVEYFCEPAGMPTWFLATAGMAASREQEIIKAARAIGRRVQVSQWRGPDRLSIRASEALSPLALWAGPAAFAAALADRLGDSPFRGFGGGRSIEEGGGASRIRTSARAALKDLV